MFVITHLHCCSSKREFVKHFVTKNKTIKLYMYSIVDSPLNGYKWVWLFRYVSLIYF